MINIVEENLDSIVKGRSSLNPDNHDQVNAMIALSNAESAKNIKESLDSLRSQIQGATYVLSTTVEQQTIKMLDSNTELNKSNKYYAEWSKRLAVALIATTLIVGCIQAVTVWLTSK